MLKNPNDQHKVARYKEMVGVKVSIIIPHYNQKECLKVLLPSVSNQTFGNYEVIIIDDCSPDKLAVEYIKNFIKEHDNVRLVENTQNLRFIKTVNKGIGLAVGEYVCLLNQDTEVKSNFVQRNVEIMDADRSIGGLSCIIVDKEGKNWFTGGRFKNGIMINLVDDFSGIRDVDFVAGTACFYRKEVFDKIGFFDEDFIMYHEDVEFGLRMNAKTNYRVCTFAEKLVVHYIVPSLPRADLYYYGNRNHIMLLRKYCRNYLWKTIVPFSMKLLRQTANLMFISVTKLDLKPLKCSWSVLKGTLNGLRTRQNY
jgi:GT2 family glycosyltransferase